MHKKSAAIILAAGKGLRMGTDVPKQYMILEGQPVIYYSLAAFDNSKIDEMVLVAAKEEMSYVKELLAAYSFQKPLLLVAGGEERYHSVYQGLLALKDRNIKKVLIHDGARPMLTEIMINDILGQLDDHPAWIVGVPVKDTIKVLNEQQEVMHTPNRERLWQVQTPQSFEYAQILKAYQQLILDKREVTDDSMVYEYYIQKPVKMLESTYENLKITTPEDMLLAREILKNRQKKAEKEK